MAALLVGAAGVAGTELALPWLLRLAVDAALGEADAAQLDRVGLAMLGTVAALYVFHTLLLRAESHVLFAASARLRRLLYTHILHQRLAFFQRSRGGELVHRVIGDTEAFEDNIVYLFSDLPFELATVVGVLTLMALTDIRLALVVVAFLAVASLISARVGRPLPTLRRTVQELTARLSGRLTEAVNGIRTVKSFGREGHEIARLDESNRSLMHLELRGGRVEALLVPVFDLMEMLGVVLIVWYGAHLILTGRLTAGGLVAFIAYMELLAVPVSNAGKYYRHFQHCRGVATRIVSFLSDQPTRPRDASAGRALPGDGPWTVAVEDLQFTYPAAMAPAVNGVSLVARAGEVLAIVGRNGAGKSTLMDLVIGLQTPNAGRITIDGVDTAEVDHDAWSDAIGVLPQDVFLFHASVAENIAYGRPRATLEEIELAVRNAGLAELVRRLPQGLGTILGDRGSRLSGGERQRVGLARVLIKRPRLVVLDEPTTHLDGDAAAVVADAVARLRGTCTTFLIAHRADTVRLADRVIVLEHGRAVNEGAPEALDLGVDLVDASRLESRKDSPRPLARSARI